MLRVLHYIALIGIIVCQAACVSSASNELRSRVLTTATALHRTEHFDFRYQPASRTAAHIKWLAADAEGQLARICQRLAVANDHRYEIFLFDDGEAIAKASGNPTLGGLAWGETAYIALQNAGARMHEISHLVIAVKIGGSRSPFLVEGLATAFVDETSFREIHAAPQRYLAQKRLPSLATLIKLDPGSSSGPAINLYDTGASFLRFLSDTHGIAKVKRFYTGESAEAVFGVPIDRLEHDWHAALARHVPTPTIVDLLAIDDERAPEWLIQVEGASVAVAWKPSLDRAATSPAAGAGQWKKDGVIIPGATEPMLRLPKLTVAQSGAYSFMANGESGNAPGPAPHGVVIILKVVPRADVEPPDLKVEDFAMHYW